MKKAFLAGIAMLTASAAFAQNSVTVSQSGGQPGNQVVVSQSGSGGSIVINQSNTIAETSNATDRKNDLARSGHPPPRAAHPQDPLSETA